MATTIRELIIKLGLDSSEVDRAFPRLDSGFSGLAKAALGVVGAVVSIRAAIATIERGEGVNNLTNAFKNLQEASGRTATDGIEKLRAATQGMLSDFDLMGASNLANQLGVTPEMFEELAAGAESLGEAVGKDLTQSLDLLTQGFGRAQDRALKQLGINVDVEKAERAYAKSLNTTRENLSELGKQEAFRTAAIEEYRKKLALTVNANASVSDSLDKVKAASQNTFDQFASGVEKNKNLAEALDKVAEAIKGIDTNNLVALVNVVVETVPTAIMLVDNFARGLRLLFSADDTTQAAKIVQQIKAIGDEIKETEANLARPKGGLFGAAANSGNQQQLAKLKEEQAALQGQYDALIAKIKTETAAVDSLGASTAGATVHVKQNAEALLNQGKMADNAAKAAADLAKKQEEVATAVAGINREIRLSSLRDYLEQAAGGNLVINREKIVGEYREAIKEGILAGLDPSDPASRAAAEAKANADALAYEQAFIASDRRVVDEQEKVMKESLQNSADFWADILTSASEGAAFNIEDILTDALKRVAIGFASQILAQMTGIGSQGLTAQGLGASLAGNLLGTLGLGSGGASGGLGGIGSLLGLAGSTGGILGNIGAFGSAALGGSFGPVASGSAYAASLSGASLGSSFAAAGPYALAAAAVYYALDKTGVLEGNFGGTTNEETQARRDARGRLQQTGLGENLEFQTIRGTTSLFDQDYNVKQNAFSSQAAGLVNPLAQIFGGGDDKLSGDIAGIFTNAVSEAKSFNEVIINTSSLMEGLGLSVDEAKGQFSALFLDGKVSLDEFAAGIASLNIVATDNLQGTGSVADALAVVGDITTTNRAKLKGLELAFKEMAEIGVDTTSEVSAYLMDQFGPSVAAVFDQLRSVGIDSWEDIKNATADQIVQIFEALQTLDERIGDTMGDTADTIKDAFQDGSDQAVASLTKIANKADEVSRRVNNSLKLQAQKSLNATGTDPNTGNNSRAA